MASILKVDTIQGATSATAVDMSSVTSLKMPSGFPVQVVNGTNSTGVYHTSNATVKIMDVSITSKLLNSSFIVQSFCSIGTPGSVTGNSDTDVALALGYKTGSASSSSSNYTGIGDYAPTRHNISFSNGNRAFYSIDALAGGGNTYSYIYFAFNEPSTCQSFSPNAAAGTTFNVALFGASDVNQTNIMFGTRRNDAGSDSGTITYIHITEVAP